MQLAKNDKGLPDAEDTEELTERAISLRIPAQEAVEKAHGIIKTRALSDLFYTEAPRTRSTRRFSLNFY